MADKLLIDLFDAYYAARKHKRKTFYVAQFEKDYERNLFELYREIKKRTYEPKPSTVFIVQKPVKREVFAADFRDRVVHHLVYGYLSPICERLFIHDSYSCRPGRGTSFGRDRVLHFIRSCSQNYTKDCSVLKLDVLGYFMNMDRHILWKKVEAILLREEDRCGGGGVGFDVLTVRFVLKKIIFHDPTENCILRGKRSDWVGLPCSKSLFSASPGKGFPIGNLTSQLFSNIYLHDFDRFVKYSLGIKYYGRYVDDVCIVHENKEYLASLIPYLDKYLKRELGLSVHPKKIYLQHYSKGVQFLGEIIKPNRRYIGSRSKGAFYRKVRYWNNAMRASGGQLDDRQLWSFLSSMNSYLGMGHSTNSYRLRRKMIGELDQAFWKYAQSDSAGLKLSIMQRDKIKS